MLAEMKSYGVIRDRTSDHPSDKEKPPEHRKNERERNLLDETREFQCRKRPRQVGFKEVF